MNQQLCIGLQSLTEEWSMLLHTVGAWFEEVDYHQPLDTHYSLIILNEQPQPQQTNILKDYLLQGGALLEVEDQITFNRKKNIQYSYRRTLPSPQHHPDFSQIGFVDIYEKAGFHRLSNLFDGFVHIQQINDGRLGYIGADVAQLLQQNNYMRKRFFFSDKQFPDELVNNTDKQGLINLFTTLLKQLHIQRDLPFVRKWTSPSQKPVFAFRIDSDFGDQASIDHLHQTLNRFDIRATWFLHVEAHENWLEHFHSFSEQEIALHGYQHGTSSNAQKIRDNIETGLQKLEEHGFDVSGFCAPYGIYNTALEQVLQEFDFSYSSEFTFAYDGLPVQPLSGSEKSGLPLQIPIHPICTGSMNRQHFTPKQMAAYFSEVLENARKRHAPIIFYHHPLQPGLKSLHPVFEQVQNGYFEHLTFREYANFWKKRQKCTFDARWDGQKLHISSSDKQSLFQVFSKADRFALYQAGAGLAIDENSPDFVLTKGYLPSESDIQEMKSHSLKLFKTSILDWKNRIRL